MPVVYEPMQGGRVLAKPSDSERTLAVMLQCAAVFFFFLPGLIAKHTSLRKKPFVRLWIKANTVWSWFSFALVLAAYLIGVLLDIGPVYVALWAVHGLIVVIAAFSCSFDQPFGYFGIANRHCRKELEAIYGKACLPEAVEQGEDIPDEL